MSVKLKEIVEKLKKENLHGPTSTPAGGNTNKRLDTRLLADLQDLDSRDPRWFDMFIEFFIDAKNEVADDILFFVRQFVSSAKSSTGSINDLDPVFVKRRVAGQIPALNDVIDWKQSFFVNLICQLPCTLTVAICQKAEDVEKNLSPDAKNLNLHLEKNSNDGAKKTSMIASKRITKKVFASPYKSRMDVKEALMNECSFPLVYYTINDYENENLHLPITSGEYLCAELSVTVPEIPTTDAYTRATSLVAEIAIEKDSDPFPLPDGYSKIVLFQGAVSFKALADVYQQKGIVAANQMRSGWGRRAAPSTNTTGPRTEYVLMRGPNGKGQCQVSIHQQNAPPPPSSPTSVLGFLKDTIKYQLGSEDSNDNIIPLPDRLECSLTYVNVPWQSVSNDLLDQ